MEPLNKIKITLFFSVFINVILLILLGNNLFNSLQKNTQFAPPFPLNNKEATYTIAKIGNNYVVNYKYGSLIGT